MCVLMIALETGAMTVGWLHKWSGLTVTWTLPYIHKLYSNRGHDDVLNSQILAYQMRYQQHLKDLCAFLCPA